MKFKLLYILSLISITLFSQVDLGNDIDTCAGDTITLDATTNNATNYRWFLNDTIINGEIQATLNITVNGLYKVEVIVNSITYTDEVNATFNDAPIAFYVYNIACDTDNNNDGFTSLNLSEYAEYITDDIVNNSVNFYLTMLDAENNTNPITSPYTNITNPQFFFTRVENITTECFTLSNFEMNIYINPTSLNPLTMCETDGDGLEEFDLTNVSGDSINTVHFYTSFSDAENEINAISTNYTNTINPQTIYAKVTNSIGCTYIATVNLEVFEKPIINTPSNLEDCHVEFDGYVPFNLSIKNAEVLNGLNTTIYQVTYHTTLDLAYSGDDALYENLHYTDVNKTLYIRVENTTTGCFSITTLDLIIVQEQITVPTHLYTCDDNNDGIEAFDLTIKSTEILNGSLSTLKFYENYNDAANNTNSIVNPQVYNNTSINQTIFVKAENTEACLSNTVSFQLRFSNPIITIGGDYFLCFNESNITLNPGFNPTIYDLEWRDENNILLSTQNVYLATDSGAYYLTVIHEESGCTSTATINIEFSQEFTVNTLSNLDECIDNTTQMATFDLTSIENQLGISLSEYEISYHISPDYAAADINSITNPEVYISDTTELDLNKIWIRITELTTGCPITIPLIINALDCNDEDNDGVLNYEEDINNNGILTDDDTDLDGIPNYQDNDDDGDTIDTNIERSTLLNREVNVFIDTDNDLIENYLDNDDDGDGILTINEDYNNNGDPTDDDTNFNNIPDYLESSVALSLISNNVDAFTIYPNPITTILNIKLKSTATKSTVYLFTINGQIVMKEVLTGLHSQINLNQLDKGFYILKVELDNQIYIQKIIKP